MTDIDVEVTVPLEDLIDAGIDPKDEDAVKEFAVSAGHDALSASAFNFSTSTPTFSVNVQEGGSWGVVIEFDSGHQRTMGKDSDGNWVEG